MGRKKECDETDGTWLRPAALAGRPPVATELEPMLAATLPRFPERPRRRGVGCGQAPGALCDEICDEICDLTVPVCEVAMLCLFGFCASILRPSSVPMSVILEDIMLGGPVVLPGYWGKLASSSPVLAAPAGVLDLEPS